MPLDLSPTIEQECQQHIVAGLKESRERFRSFVSIRNAADAVGATVIRAFGQKRQKPGWLTAAVVANFVRDRVDAIFEAQRRGTDLLTDELPAVHEPELTAAKVVNELRTLPWRYEAWFSVPLIPLALPHGNFVLDDTCRLIRSDRTTSEVYSLTPVDDSDAASHHRQYPESVLPDQVYLVGTKVGYIQESERFDDLREFANAAKGLLGLLLVQGGVYFELLGHRAPPPAVPILLFRLNAENERPAPGMCRWFSHDDSATLLRMRPRAEWSSSEDARATLEHVRPAFRDNATRTAARWFLDSFAGAEGPLQVVQATIVLEILLGDRRESDLLGLASLLSNRLAYLIGQTPKQRREIVADVKRLYDLRSKIVHSGVAEMDEEGRHALFDLQRYARLALHSQIGGLAEDDKMGDRPSSG